MISYLLEVSLCWSAFYLIYFLLLRKETFFKLNRIYLLTTLLLGLFIPLLPKLSSIWFIASQPSLAVSYLQPIHVGVQQIEGLIVQADPASDDGIVHSLLIIYLVGVLFFFLRFALGLRQIYQLFRNATIVRKKDHVLVLTKSVHFPFSFFHYLFWSEEMAFAGEDHQIIDHEIAHINEWHTLDVILAEILCVLFWCSPLIFLYKKSLRVIHEYLADAMVLKTNHHQQYGQLLLKQSQSGLQIALANNFFHSQLKQRIAMMTKRQSRPKVLWKYLFTLPVFLLLITLFVHKNAQADINQKNLINLEVFQQSTPQLSSPKVGSQDTIPSPTVAIKGEVFKVVEEMPRLRLKDTDCEELSAQTEKNRCAQKQLISYIYNHIKYPAEAKKEGIEGMVIVQFIVDKEGNAVNAKIVRSIGGGCEEEVLRVVNGMDKWVPGKQRGKAVNVQYSLPVQFKLDPRDDLRDKNKSTAGNIISSSFQNKITDHQSDQQPLYFVNGLRQFEGAQNIDSDLIEKIEVLKGDAAVAYAGEAGTNGVVLITLKKLGSSLKKEARPNFSGQEEIFKVVEEMPRFPGCEEVDLSAQEKHQCANQKLMQFVGEHLHYPTKAKAKGIEGVAVVGFVVETDGSLSNPEIVRSLDEEIDREVLRLIAQMNEMPEKWMPGKQRGKAVKVQFNLPVRFSMENQEQNLPIDTGVKLELKDFRAYPNPANELLRLHFISAPSPITVMITDLVGKEIFRESLKNFDGNYDREVNISRAARGTLLLQIQQDDKIFTSKLIHQ